MRSSTTHKVCFPIGGRPAILRAMDAYSQAGIASFTVVVGAMASQVMETVVSDYPQTMFAYQPNQRGTGNAARVGVAPLRAAGYDGPLLVTMGDKLVHPRAVATLLDLFNRSGADAAVAVLPRRPGSEGGRILLRKDASFAGIVEQRDIQKAAILAEAAHVVSLARDEAAAAMDELAELTRRAIPDQVKRRVALGAIEDAIQSRDVSALQRALQAMPKDCMWISLGQDRFTPAEAEESSYQNAAVYVFQAQALYESLNWITADNAQQEEYLTDAVNWLANARDEAGNLIYRLVQCVLSPDDVLTYNNPEELLRVEEMVRRWSDRDRVQPVASNNLEATLPRGSYRTVNEWLSVLEDGGAALRDALLDIYGPDAALWQERLQAYRKALVCFGDRFGYNRKVILVRAPGRVNLMGRHIEHRGGSVNVMAINKEAVLIAAPRTDDVVRIANTDSTAYPDAQFRIGAEIADLPWDDWLNYINNDKVQQLVRDSRGAWVNYVKAAFLRLQFQFRDRRIRGMDAVYSGNIPVAAGLSSSSAIVVASAEAAVALNALTDLVTPQDFVDLCGEGEWYVGSRGGAGDHAAMKFGRRGMVTQIGFFPFRVQGAVPFPDGYKLVVANSGIKAAKMTNARDTFNQRVASYEIGMMLAKEVLKSWAGSGAGGYAPGPRIAADRLARIERVRDLNPHTMGAKLSDVYRLLLALPQALTPEQVREKLGDEYGSDLDRIFRTHAAPEHYLIRSVMLYGIAECSRAEMCRQLLEQGQVETLGRMMKISHDGDRVVRWVTESDGDGELEAAATVESTESTPTVVAGDQWLPVPYDFSASDEYLRRLVEDCQSEEIDRLNRAQLHLQPGGYACSTPEIDEMVDLALGVPGVVGAQLSGAGLGGCIMVLVRDDAVDELTRTLGERFYSSRGIQPDVTVCAPTKGSGLISVQ